MCIRDRRNINRVNLFQETTPVYNETQNILATPTEGSDNPYLGHIMCLLFQEYHTFHNLSLYQPHIPHARGIDSVALRNGFRTHTE